MTPDELRAIRAIVADKLNLLQFQLQAHDDCGLYCPSRAGIQKEIDHVTRSLDAIDRELNKE